MPLEVRDALAHTREIVEKALAAGLPALDEAAAKQVLAAYGVPIPAGGLVHSATEAADLASSLGVPVAMKAAGALIQHKTEKRLVVLDVRTPDEAAETYAALAERAGDALEAVLVEEMVSGSREFMVGMNRDAAFGPVVAFGLGGVMTEVFRDIALAVTPGAEGDVAGLPDLINGSGAARRVPGPAGRGPRRGWSPSSRRSRGSPPTTRRSPRSTSIRCSSAAPSPSRPMPSWSCRPRSRPRRLPAPSPRISRPSWRRRRWPSSAPPATWPAGAGRRCRTSSRAGSKARSTRSTPRAASSSVCRCRRASRTCPPRRTSRSSLWARASCRK